MDLANAMLLSNSVSEKQEHLFFSLHDKSQMTNHKCGIHIPREDLWFS